MEAFTPLLMMHSAYSVYNLVRHRIAHIALDIWSDQDTNNGLKTKNYPRVHAVLRFASNLRSADLPRTFRV